MQRALIECVEFMSFSPTVFDVKISKPGVQSPKRHFTAEKRTASAVTSLLKLYLFFDYAAYSKNFYICSKTLCVVNLIIEYKL